MIQHWGGPNYKSGPDDFFVWLPTSLSVPPVVPSLVIKIDTGREPPSDFDTGRGNIATIYTGAGED